MWEVVDVGVETKVEVAVTEWSTPYGPLWWSISLLYYYYYTPQMEYYHRRCHRYHYAHQLNVICYYIYKKMKRFECL